MSGINTRRVILGGLLAGLIINISETILNIPVMGRQYDEAIQRLGLAALSGGTIGMFVVMSFIEGILCVWLYAAIRPRYGPGVGTAIRAGLFVWFFVAAWSAISQGAMGMFPVSLLAVSTMWIAVEIPLATIAGAWLYREDDSTTFR